jgi:hypothetical protein
MGDEYFVLPSSGMLAVAKLRAQMMIMTEPDMHKERFLPLNPAQKDLRFVVFANRAVTSRLVACENGYILKLL